MNTRMISKLVAAALAISAVTNASGTDATAVVGSSTAPAAGTAASGSTVGAFLDLAQDASWVGGAKPSGDGIATFNNGGYVGTSTNLIFNKLSFTGTTTGGALYGSVYRTTSITASEVRTITVGGGGIASGTTGPRFGETLVINVGATDQPWIASGNFNFLARVAGSATITVSGASGVSLRNNNSTTDSIGYPTAFTGTWKIESGSIVNVGNGAYLTSTTLGAPSATVVLNGGTLRYTVASTYTDRNITLIAASTLRANNNLGDINVNQAISGGTTNAPLDLTLDANGNSTTTPTALKLGGDLSGHVGSLIIAKNYSGFSASLASGSTNSFVLGVNHVVDGVDTTAQALIRAGIGANATALHLNGTFSFDFNNAELTTGNTWQLVDMSGLTTTYGASFAISRFTVGSGSAGSRMWTRVVGNNTWTYTEATGALSLSINGTPTRTPYTTGATNDLSQGIAWSTGTVPGPSDIPNFTVALTYTAPAGTNLFWLGMTVNAVGTLEINPATGGNSYTIHLGTSGISGSQNIDRLGNGLTLDVGANNQTWGVEMANVQAVINGSATVTYTSASRLWLRSSSGFTGIWRADGGGIHPDLNTCWSSSAGATGQLLNNGYVRLSNSAYDRFRIEMVGSGRLLTSGSTTEDGAVSTFNRGSGIGTGTITGTGDLTIEANNNYGKIAFNGTCSHAGDIIITDKSAGVHLNLGATATNTFYIAANGVNNKIRGLSSVNSRLSAAGTFVFDLSGAELVNNSAWTVVDVGTLNESFEATFTVDGFLKSATTGLWRKSVPEGTWLFSEATGVLTFETKRGTLVQFL